MCVLCNKILLDQMQKWIFIELQEQLEIVGILAAVLLLQWATPETSNIVLYSREYKNLPKINCGERIRLMHLDDWLTLEN